MNRRHRFGWIVFTLALAGLVAFVISRLDIIDVKNRQHSIEKANSFGTKERKRSANSGLSNKGTTGSQNRSSGQKRSVQPPVAFSPSPFHITTITNSGNIPSSIANNLGLNSDQIASVQAETSHFWKEMEEATAARSTYDDVNSDSTIGKDVYRIPALPDQGDEYIAGFRKRIKEIAGDKAAAALIAGMSRKPFGGFGRYDVKLTFEPDEFSVTKNETKVRYEYTDPKTGSLVFSGKSTLESFSKSFGNWSAPDSTK